MARPQDLQETLADWAATGERDAPYAFVGRMREREVMRTLAQRLPPKIGVGQTILITGAPGEGKTALMEQGVKDALAEGKPTAVVSLQPEQADTDKPAERFYQLAAHYLAQGPNPLTPQVAKERTVRVGLPNAASASWIARHPDGRAPIFRSIEEIAASLQGARPKPCDRLIVTIDEAQNIDPDGKLRELLQNLHTQRQLPIMVICAGLSNTLEVFDAAGISRPTDSCILRPGRLAEDEAAECVRRAATLLATKGLKASPASIEQWANRLAKASDGWPRHLQTYMREVFRALHALPGSSLDQVNMDAAIEAGDQSRRRHYAQRLHAGSTNASVVAALHREIAEGKVNRRLALGVIRRAVERMRGYDPEAAEDWQDAFGGKPSDCYSAMLKSGLISEDDENWCFVPIPSLASYVAQRAAVEEEAAMRSASRSGAQQPGEGKYNPDRRPT